ncbi:hypothetical protein MMC2321_03015 [Chitinophaga sp. MM2321]
MALIMRSYVDTWSFGFFDFSGNFLFAYMVKHATKISIFNLISEENKHYTNFTKTFILSCKVSEVFTK